FSDTTTAKEIALSQNNKGAEIVFHAAGGSGLGVFQGASEGGFYAIGCNSNQNHLDPDAIVASMMKRVDTASFEIVKSAMVTDDLNMGATTTLGISNDGCGYAVENSNMTYSEADLAIVDAIKAEIAAGNLVIPETMEEIETFLAENTYEG
ncbi:MAG: BMP family ABC transporter substrate-binding protein, partial [Eubacteriales bacterium]